MVQQALLAALCAAALVPCWGADPAAAQEPAAGPPGLIEAARAEVRTAWERDSMPRNESPLNRIAVQAIERRNRLAPGQEIYLVHAFAEAAWWKVSEHHLLVLRPQETGWEVLYRHAGGTDGKGVEHRLVEVGSRDRRSALEISDYGVDGAISGTLTLLVLYLPESDRFAEVFRRVTTFWPAAEHAFESRLSFRESSGPLRDLVVETDLYLARPGTLDHRRTDTVESVFAWTGLRYEGSMPLPDAWRSGLP